MRGSTSQGLTLPMRYIMRKRLKSPEEVTERRQVGDAESLVNAGPADGGGGYRQNHSEL
ncbi:hypothetical protein QBC39DRAFT_266793 [Podospora conica]|nr:hypothetical protein QBC39DRAFT_266793 [Schizothecium conicum]